MLQVERCGCYTEGGVRVNGFSVINCTFCCSTQRYTMGTWETTNAIRYGFTLGFEYGSPCRPTRKIMKSALQHPVVVDDYLARECG